MYVKVKNGQVETYPFNGLESLRASNPNTSFPSQMPDANLAEWDVYPVTPVAPQPDTREYYYKESLPVFTAGAWVQTWQKVMRTQAEIAAHDLYYVPMPLVRERLEAAGKWDAAVGAMTAAQRLKLATLREGIANNDATAAALLNAIGADPAVILARP